MKGIASKPCQLTGRILRRRSVGLGKLLLMALVLAASSRSMAESFSDVIETVQPKMVKIYGAGGVRGLEAYQSGVLISGNGHILTAWSYVLDTEFVVAVLDDGRRFQAKLFGADPSLEIAILKVDAEALPHYDIADSIELNTGDRVLSFSNLFGVAAGDEQASVLHGIVTAKMQLSARRGAFETPYRGSAYVVDAMTNNPGAAGGALTDRSGRLAGLLGKELRSSMDNTWLNYAVPLEELRDSVEAILSGQQRPRGTDSQERKPLEPATLALLGITLLPDLLSKTPPFIDQIRSDSPADKAGLRPDDVVLFVNGQIVRSVADLREELSYIDRIDEVRLIVQRVQQLIEVALFATE